MEVERKKKKLRSGSSLTFIKSSKVITKLMEKNSKIVNDDVQQPEDEINRAPQLNDEKKSAVTMRSRLTSDWAVTKSPSLMTSRMCRDSVRSRWRSLRTSAENGSRRHSGRSRSVRGSRTRGARTKEKSPATKSNFRLGIWAWKKANSSGKLSLRILPVRTPSRSSRFSTMTSSSSAKWEKWWPAGSASATKTLSDSPLTGACPAGWRKCTRKSQSRRRKWSASFCSSTPRSPSTWRAQRSASSARARCPEAWTIDCSRLQSSECERLNLT